MTAAKAIDIRNAWVRYDGDIILEDITLGIAEREIVSIVGPNGSGKSTLLRAIMGLKECLRGGVEVFGRSPARARQEGMFGYLPQASSYDARFPVSVFDVVAMSRYARKGLMEKLARQDRSLIEESLDRVGMRDISRVHFGSLSGGQKQRVLIARALALKPRVLMLDEPATGLDAVAQDGFYDMLKELRDRDGLTILMVSHDIGTVSTIVDRLACVKRKLHFHGKPGERIPDATLAKVFGRNIHVVKHDRNCPTCRGE
ncbi:MAG TPA: metal ABC transporter ATP-binding protein [Spirochaetota bacterium]|nr:metal ABC transporter ATP-binding protein [Spirochaetota bacterium]